MKKLQGSGIIFAGAAVVIMASQPVWAQAARVTAVQLNQTNSGFNVVLQTSTGSARPQVFTSKRGNTLVADIINAQLRLPQGNNFRQDKPAAGINSVIITQLDPNSVRMVITGNTSAPSSQILQRNAQGITLSISPSGTPSSKQPANNSAIGAAPQRRQPTQKPNVLVPNPEVTVDNVPVAPGATAQAEKQVPAPFLPRAIAPPVGDIAVSNTDSTPALIQLGTNERVPRLVLRDAPVREVLALLARAAGLNLAYTTATPPGGQQQGQQTQPGTAADEGPRISLDIQDESVQDVFNYVLRVSGLQANREGRTIFVGTRLPNDARNVIVRSLRMNQVTVGVALNFLVAMGAESAVSRERTITSVQAVPVGGAQAPATQTQTSTETRIETQRIDFQDSIPLLRGLQIVGDERTNSVTLIGSPKQIDIATAQLIQIDSRRRQVAVNVKIVDVNLLATEDFNTSFSFGIGDSFFVNDGGAAALNFGGTNPPSRIQTVTPGGLTPPVISNPILGLGEDVAPFFDLNREVRLQGPGIFNSQTGGFTPSPDVRSFGAIAPLGDSLTPGVSQFEPGTPGSVTVNPTTGVPVFTQPTSPRLTYSLPSLFQFPKKFLSSLQAQVVNGNAKILTDPTLIVQEGQQANVNLTQQVVGNVTIERTDTAAGTRETERVEKENVGLTLSIRVERIDDNGFIGLSVAPVVRAPQASFETSEGNTISLVSERSLNSGLIRLRDSQTLILSGIIQDSDRTTVSKVPILGDIPILGALFRSTNRVNQRQEVIVLLTPQIMDDAERSSSMGYNYTPSPEARQMLERNRRGLQVPSSKP